MSLFDYFGLVASAFAAGLALRHVARLRFDPNTRFTTPGEAKALAVADSSTPRVSAAAGVTLIKNHAVHAATANSQEA